MANVAELKRMIQEWFDAHGDDEVFRLFEEYRVPYAPVLAIEEAMAHPHLREREIVRKYNDRFLGEFDIPGFPIRFSAYPRHPELDAPTLGEHNQRGLGRISGIFRQNASRSSRQTAFCIAARAKADRPRCGGRIDRISFTAGNDLNTASNAGEIRP